MTDDGIGVGAQTVTGKVEQVVIEKLREVLSDSDYNPSVLRTAARRITKEKWEAFKVWSLAEEDDFMFPVPDLMTDTILSLTLYEQRRSLSVLSWLY